MLAKEDLTKLIKKVHLEEYRHPFYDKSVALAKEIEETFCKNYPDWMKKSRPKESKKIKEYRESVFQNPCIGEATRITDKYVKIEQADGFSITYPSENNEQNALEEYCEKGFFGYNTLINYTFSSIVTKMNRDANAVIAVMDKEPVEDEAESRKPFPYIFGAGDVLDYEPNKYFLLRGDEDVFKTIYYILDDTNYYIAEVSTNYITLTTVKHYCNSVPARLIGQYIEKEEDGRRLLKSILHDTIPHFRSAINRFNDIEVELIHHINTKAWSMAPVTCRSCKGEGKVGKEGKKCPTCNGTGTSRWDTLEELLIDPVEGSKLYGDSKFPFSTPAGYVPRNVDALKVMQESYKEHIDEGYSAIDMGILRVRRSNTSESAISKKMDRLEYSQKIYSGARHLIENILTPIYKDIDNQLFGFSETREKRIPQITTPMDFDLMSPEAILEEIKKGVDGGMSAEVLGALKLKYAKLVIGEDSRETKTLMDQIVLDPLYGKGTDELELLMGGGDDSATSVLDRTDVVMSANFKGLIDRALREHSDWDIKYEIDKYNILRGYAQEILDKKIKEDANIDFLINGGYRKNPGNRPDDGRDDIVD